MGLRTDSKDDFIAGVNSEKDDSKLLFCKNLRAGGKRKKVKKWQLIYT